MGCRGRQPLQVLTVFVVLSVFTDLSEGAHCAPLQIVRLPIQNKKCQRAKADYAKRTK